MDLQEFFAPMVEYIPEDGDQGSVYLLRYGAEPIDEPGVVSMFWVLPAHGASLLWTPGDLGHHFYDGQPAHPTVASSILETMRGDPRSVPGHYLDGLAVVVVASDPGPGEGSCSTGYSARGPRCSGGPRGSSGAWTSTTSSRP